MGVCRAPGVSNVQVFTLYLIDIFFLKKSFNVFSLPVLHQNHGEGEAGHPEGHGGRIPGAELYFRLKCYSLITFDMVHFYRAHF